MITTVKLANGIRAVLVPCEAQSVAFGLFVGSGSRHEPKGMEGVSHFLEHMLFKGTARRSSKAITEAIEGRGGNFNAWTTEESTAYFSHMPFEYLDEAVDIISDMYLNASINEVEFKKEREVVIEEIKMYLDEPDSVAMENLQTALFPKNRLGLPVAGNEKALRSLTAEAMREYKRLHYTAANTVAVLVGRFEVDEAVKILEKRLGFAKIVESFKDKADKFAPPVADVLVKKDVQQTQIALGFRSLPISHKLKYALSVFDAIMGRGMASRLFQEVREKRGLSYDISSRQQFFADTGMWTITAGVDAAKANKTIEVIDRELEKIRAKKVSLKELKRIKEFLLGNFRLSHEKIQSKLFYYGSTMLSFGRVVPIEEQIEGIRAVSVDDVAAVAEIILKKGNRSLSRVVPK